MRYWWVNQNQGYMHEVGSVNECQWTTLGDTILRYLIEEKIILKAISRKPIVL
jgi:hypothetical protein